MKTIAFHLENFALSDYKSDLPEIWHKADSSIKCDYSHTFKNASIKLSPNMDDNKQVAYTLSGCFKDNFSLIEDPRRGICDFAIFHFRRREGK